ncbi:MAG: copper resistance CopC family protein [Propionibacteriaceae bacterium]
MSSRLLAVLAGAVLTLVVGAAPAAAHNTLKTTNPSDGQTVASTPRQVVLMFDEPAVAMGTQILVTGPSGQVQVGPPRLVDNTVTQAVQPGAPAGAYTVAWRVTSSDGHPISGSFAFSSQAASAGTPPTPEASPSGATDAGSGGSGRVLLVVGGLALAVALLVIRVGIARRRKTN